MKQSERIKRIAQILKTRFPNLAVQELLNLCYEIDEAVEDDPEND